MTHPPKQPDAAPVAPAMLSAAGVATYLSISPRTVWRCAATGELPRPVRMAGRTLWRRSDIDAVIKNLEVGKK